jgi:hypothetical protein
VIVKLTDKIVRGAGTSMDYVTILTVMFKQAFVVLVVMWAAFTLICMAFSCVPSGNAVFNMTSVLASRFVGAR